MKENKGELIKTPSDPIKGLKSIRGPLCIPQRGVIIKETVIRVIGRVIFSKFRVVKEGLGQENLEKKIED